MREHLRIRAAVMEDMRTIIRLIDEAASWLRHRDTDQWAHPWPNRAARDARVMRGLQAKRTWIVEDDQGPVATVTYHQHANPKLWNPFEQSERAIYLCRLIVSRKASGEKIGARIIDWAGCQAKQGWTAEWVRIDVWTTNLELHRYYEKQGFEFRGLCNDVDYPSAALFQKPTADIIQPHGLESDLADQAPAVCHPALPRNA
jgi:GNAT superfamily N-acetyltransferase